MADRAHSAEAAEKTRMRRGLRLAPAILRRELKTRSQTTPFLIWVSFLLSFGLTRWWVYAAGSVGGGARAQAEEVSFSIGRNIIFYGYHIHHIAIGILLLALAGWAALHWKGRNVARVAALMYGVGLGFIVDELGFVIGNIRPYDDDVEVFYLAVFLGALLMSAVYFPQFWRRAREDLHDVGRIIRRLPALDRPRKRRAEGEIQREMDKAWGPAPGAAATAAAVAAPKAQGPAVDRPVSAAREPLDKDAIFSRLLARIVDVLLLVVFAGLLLGIAKLIVSLRVVFVGLSVRSTMQPILVGALTILIGVELFRAMLEFVRTGRVMLPFLADAGILLALRELAVEVSAREPDPLLVGVLGGTLVALGGLCVFLARTILPPPGRGASPS